MTTSEIVDPFHAEGLGNEYRMPEHSALKDEKTGLSIIVRGFRVHPIGRDKRPLLTGWPKLASSSPDVIAAWQKQFPDCNWGVALDADMFVIDCDSEAAASALYDLGEGHGGIPSTLTTLTGRGFHLWFRKPLTDALKVRNRVNVMPGIDVRADGGFVVVPPSVHQNGKKYEFAWDDAPIVDAPEWLLRLVTGIDDVNTNTKIAVMVPVKPEPVEEPSPFLKDVASRGWEKRVAPGKVPDGRSPFALRIALEPQNVTKGTRNESLFAYLCRLRGEGKPEAYIRSEAWRVVARIPEPMSKFEVERIIANALKFNARAVGNNSLMEAWHRVEQIEAGRGASKWYRFLLLVEQLAKMRPDTRPTILLPVRSIGILLNVHFTQVAKWRRRAVEMGFLSKTAGYVRRRLADEFAVRAGFSPLDDGPALYKVKRGRKPKKPVGLDQAA